METRRALVLFSGGQDSATVLAWALAQHRAGVETVGFDYGQTHRVELESRGEVLAAIREEFPDWAGRLGPDHLVDLSGFGAISATALTGEVEIVMGANGVPTTFVPGRNLAFLTAAGAVGYRRGIDVLVAGVCETDYSGYPDCRRATINAMADALALGLERPIVIETPLMHLSKAQTWALAEALGGPKLVEVVRTRTHTCYRGVREALHPWGYGCGDCPACVLRARGWETYRRGETHVVGAPVVAVAQAQAADVASDG